MPRQDTENSGPPRLAYSERDLDAGGIATRKTRWRWRREGTFPEPVVAGGRKLYRATDIERWLKDLEKTLKPNDTLTILQAVSGG